jgi:RNA polymerase sigma-70 factor (ECF subfamily)
MPENESAQLLAQWQDGNEEAAQALFRRHAERLMGLVRLRLSEKMARRLDPEDVVQSVYRSFFAGARAGRFAFDQSGDIWRLLVVLAKNKLHHQVEYHRADKRDFDREDPNGSLGALDLKLFANEPTPAEAVHLADEVESVMRALEPSQRQIFELRLQGYTLSEISGESGRSLRTVRRVLDRIKSHLERMCA